MNYTKKYAPELFANQTNNRLSVNTMTEDQIQNAQTVSPIELHTKIASANPPIVVDIRGNFAYTVGSIKGSINILDELFSQIIEQGKTLPIDQEIVIVCSVGKISCKYAAFLKTQGHIAFSLEGGIKNWKSAGLELTKII
jgi:rhodanese-related sulfurtransferase